jgi:hypothetical protein
MALSNAERQRRHRDKRKAEDLNAIERALLHEVEREMSDQERIALADKLADLAKDFLWRAHKLANQAYKLRTGNDHPRQG